MRFLHYSNIANQGCVNVLAEKVKSDCNTYNSDGRSASKFWSIEATYRIKWTTFPGQSETLKIEAGMPRKSGSKRKKNILGMLLRSWGHRHMKNNILTILV